MIGTNSPIRMRAAFFVLVLAAAGLSLVLGCSETPLSVDSGVKNVSYSSIPIPQGHKPDAVTICGIVEEIEYAALRLRVGGLWFFTDPETEIEIDDCKPCLFTAIQVGDPAKITHDRIPAHDGARYAREVEIEHEEDDNEAETAGIVEIIEANRLFVAGSWFWLDGETEIEIDGDCDVDEILAGDRVKIEHAAVIQDGLGQYAYKIEIERDCDEDEDSEIEEE